MDTKPAVGKGDVTFTPVSWGVGRGTTVTDTRAHLQNPDEPWRTLCGVKIPVVVRHHLDGHWIPTVPRSVFPNSADETDALPRCARCLKSAHARKKVTT